MAYFRMSLGNAIFMAFTFISYVAGITGTLDSYEEQPAYIFAEVAHTRLFDLEIRSNYPEWFSEGMEIFPYAFRSAFWRKRNLKWAIVKDPTVMTREYVVDVLNEAFGKWAVALKSKFTFDEAQPDEKPDIRIKFVPEMKYFYESLTIDLKKCMDLTGVDVEFVDAHIWTEEWHLQGWSNFKFSALYEIGHVLGLGESPVASAVMYKGNNPASEKRDEPNLSEDDIKGIRKKYNIPLDDEPKSKSESESGTKSESK